VSWLIDTNVASELRRGSRANPGVIAWADRARHDPVYTSVLVIGELRRGVELRRPHDPVAATALEHWVRRLVESYADRILPVDQAVAERWATLGIPDRLPTADGLIAATALVHDLTLVTRNVRDMARAGVRLLDPFAES
jgi:predicted nucleic acid-binding protein